MWRVGVVGLSGCGGTAVGYSESHLKWGGGGGGGCVLALLCVCVCVCVCLCTWWL